MLQVLHACIYYCIMCCINRSPPTGRYTTLPQFTGGQLVMDTIVSSVCVEVYT